MHQPKLEQTLRTHSGLLARIAASYERDPALREDLLQDIAVALWRALPRWRSEAQLKTFVARVAHNRGVDHLIRRSRLQGDVELSAELPDPQPGPDRSAESGDRLRALADAVRRLPLAQRQVVTLALEGFRNVEIAQALELETNAVDVRLSRARAALRRTLGEGDDR